MILARGTMADHQGVTFRLRLNNTDLSLFRVGTFFTKLFNTGSLSCVLFERFFFIFALV